MKANVTVAAFYVQCPNCDADVSSPHGSLMWATNEAEPEQIVCDMCDTKLSLPAKARKWLTE